MASHLKIGEFSRLARVSVRMLRYYDEQHLLRPAYVDASSGYRHYAPEQLGTLHRILALQDLGFSLGQVGSLLEGASPEQVQALLEQKHTELRHQILQDQERLKRIEARLAHLSNGGDLPPSEVILKHVEPRRMACLRDTVSTFPDASKLGKELFAYLSKWEVKYTAGAGLTYIYHDPNYAERQIDVEVAYPVTEAIPSGRRVRVVEVPGGTVAAVVHRGDVNKVHHAYTALCTWISANDYEICGPSRNVIWGTHDSPVAPPITEVQWPVKGSANRSQKAEPGA